MIYKIIKVKNGWSVYSKRGHKLECFISNGELSDEAKHYLKDKMRLYVDGSFMFGKLFVTREVKGRYW